MMAMEILEPSFLILDFTNLDYAWGDMLESVFSLNVREHQHSPSIALVVGECCKDAIGTLIDDNVDSTKPATDEEWIFDNIEDAWAYAEENIS